jgi:hypothetical protein
LDWFEEASRGQLMSHGLLFLYSDTEGLPTIQVVCRGVAALGVLHDVLMY